MDFGITGTTTETFKTIEMKTENTDHVEEQLDTQPMTEERIEKLSQEIGGVEKRTLRMIRKGMKELEEGNVSDPIDIHEDFPELFE